MTGPAPPPPALTAAPGSSIGAAVHWNPSVATNVVAFERLTARRMQVRRAYSSGIPGSFAATGLTLDRTAGRGAFWSYKPTSTSASAVAASATLASACSAAGMGPARLDVIIYHEPYDNFPDGSVFVRIFNAHAAPWQRLGYRVWICLTAWSINHHNALATHWSDQANGLAVDIYGDSSASAHTDLATATAHARARGKLLGIAETAGGPREWPVDKGVAFLSTLVEWTAQNTPRLVCYWSDTVLDASGQPTYDARIEHHHEYLTMYWRLYDACAVRA